MPAGRAARSTRVIYAGGVCQLTRQPLASGSVEDRDGGGLGAGELTGYGDEV